MMDDQTAEQVARIVRAHKSRSLFAGLVVEREDCPDDQLPLVDEGVAAIGKIIAD